MPEQPQWSERTLDMPPQDPWADQPTASTPPAPPMPTRAQPAPPMPTRAQPTPPRAQPAPPMPTRAQPAPTRTEPMPAVQGRQAPPAPQRPPGSPPRERGPQAASAAVPGPDAAPFSRGRAQVTPRPQAQRPTAEHENTGTGWPAADPGWPGAEPPRAERRPLAWHVQQLRRGGEWSSAAVLFAFVCWGIWAISTDGNLTSSVVVFAIGLVVAAGLFALARLLGRIVWERQLGRVRRTARGAHLVAAVFLVGVGLAHLQQTPWVMDAYRWVAGQL